VKEIAKLLAILILGIFLTSCSKSVYISKDLSDFFQFTLYKENFKYQEYTALGKFSIWGTYEIKDSLIYFEFRDKKRIPYNYLSNNIRKRETKRNSQFQILHLVDKEYDEPILFASVVLKDKLGKIFASLESDMDGIAIIKNNSNIGYVEVSFLGYTKQIFNYDTYFDSNLEIKLEQLKPGGRLSEGCLIDYIDVILEYKVDNPSNITKLERNGVVFKKKVESQ